MQYDCLIIDDEKLLADSTAEYFNLFGVKTAAVYTAADCRRFLQEHSVQLLLLDINLGDSSLIDCKANQSSSCDNTVSGFELCRELREKTAIPILFLSARSSDDDKIIALNIGGDDYIQKPCSLGVLLAKVKVVLKRFGQSGDTGYSDGWLAVNFDAREVMVEGQPVKLTAMEFRLLAYLIRNGNRVVPKQELFEAVWEDKFTGDGTLNVHIRRIREAIERNPSEPEYVVTVWGDGYRFHGKGTSQAANSVGGEDSLCGGVR